MTNRTRTDFLLLAGFCAFLFFYGLGQFGLIGADEPRYAQVAREMLQSRDWITPTLGGEPWLEKPPLYYWQAAIAYKIFGVSDWVARLPSAIDATLLVLAIYYFLRRFRSGFEIDGSLIIASSAGIIGYGRAASMDMALAAAFTVSMLAWWAWRESGKKKFLALFYIFLGLGMLAKGPVAPFLAVLIIFLYAAAIREVRIVQETIWMPGLLSFCAIALPWYIAVQMRNPGFFRVFVLEHNLGRFSHNLYHHVEPVWYYIPVTAVALLPWTVFIAAAIAQTLPRWWSEHGWSEPRRGEHRSIGQDKNVRDLAIFAFTWLLAPLLFFSFSRSKLPGYILLALPAGGLLLVEYLRRRLENAESKPAKALVLLHALVAAAPTIPALLIVNLISQHRLPAGRPMLVALAVAFALCAGIALTLAGKTGIRMLRFTTLIPVVLTIAAVLKLGSVSIDQTLSARPLAEEISGMQTKPLPLAIYHVRRELEYGLTFYRNQVTFNYDWGRLPPEEHLLVAPENSQKQIADLLPDRRVSHLGNYSAQHVDYYWISSAGVTARH